MPTPTLAEDIGAPDAAPADSPPTPTLNDELNDPQGQALRQHLSEAATRATDLHRRMAAHMQQELDIQRSRVTDGEQLVHPEHGRAERIEFDSGPRWFRHDTQDEVRPTGFGINRDEPARQTARNNNGWYNVSPLRSLASATNPDYRERPDELTAWERYSAQFRQRFPGTDPEVVHEAFNQAYQENGRDAIMQMRINEGRATSSYNRVGIGGGSVDPDYVISRIPFGAFAQAASYVSGRPTMAAAEQRIQSGQGTDQDYRIVGNSYGDAMRAAAPGHTGERYFDFFSSLPGIAAEMYMTRGGWGVGRAATQSILTRVLGPQLLTRMGATVAGRAALSATLQAGAGIGGTVANVHRVAEQAISRGGGVGDWVRAFADNVIMNSVGAPAALEASAGRSFLGAAARSGAGALVQQRIVETAGGMLDYMTGSRPNFGALGQFLGGNPEDAFHHALMEFVGFGAMGAMNANGGRRELPSRANGYGRNMPANQHVSAVAEWLTRLQQDVGERYFHEAATDHMNRGNAVFADLMANHPNMTREAFAERIKDMPEGWVKDIVKINGAVLPSENKPANLGEAGFTPAPGAGNERFGEEGTPWLRLNVGGTVKWSPGQPAAGRGPGLPAGVRQGLRDVRQAPPPDYRLPTLLDQVGPARANLEALEHAHREALEDVRDAHRQKNSNIRTMAEERAELAWERLQAARDAQMEEAKSSMPAVSQEPELTNEARNRGVMPGEPPQGTSFQARPGYQPEPGSLPPQSPRAMPHEGAPHGAMPSEPVGLGDANFRTPPNESMRGMHQEGGEVISGSKQGLRLEGGEDRGPKGEALKPSPIKPTHVMKALGKGAMSVHQLAPRINDVLRKNGLATHMIEAHKAALDRLVDEGKLAKLEVDGRTVRESKIELKELHAERLKLEWQLRDLKPGQKGQKAIRDELKVLHQEIAQTESIVEGGANDYYLNPEETVKNKITDAEIEKLKAETKQRFIELEAEKEEARKTVQEALKAAKSKKANLVGMEKSRGKVPAVSGPGMAEPPQAARAGEGAEAAQVGSADQPTGGQVPGTPQIPPIAGVGTPGGEAAAGQRSGEPGGPSPVRLGARAGTAGVSGKGTPQPISAFEINASIDRVLETSNYNVNKVIGQLGPQQGPAMAQLREQLIETNKLKAGDPDIRLEEAMHILSQRLGINDFQPAKLPYPVQKGMWEFANKQGFNPAAHLTHEEMLEGFAAFAVARENGELTALTSDQQQAAAWGEKWLADKGMTQPMDRLKALFDNYKAQSNAQRLSGTISKTGKPAEPVGLTAAEKVQPVAATVWQRTQQRITNDVEVVGRMAKADLARGMSQKHVAQEAMESVGILRWLASPWADDMFQHGYYEVQPDGSWKGTGRTYADATKDIKPEERDTFNAYAKARQDAYGYQHQVQKQQAAQAAGNKVEPLTVTIEQHNRAQEVLRELRTTDPAQFQRFVDAHDKLAQLNLDGLRLLEQVGYLKPGVGDLWHAENPYYVSRARVFDSMTEDFLARDRENRAPGKGGPGMFKKRGTSDEQTRPALETFGERFGDVAALTRKQSIDNELLKLFRQDGMGTWVREMHEKEQEDKTKRTYFLREAGELRRFQVKDQALWDYLSGSQGAGDFSVQMAKLLGSALPIRLAAKAVRIGAVGVSPAWHAYNMLPTRDPKTFMERTMNVNSLPTLMKWYPQWVRFLATGAVAKGSDAKPFVDFLERLQGHTQIAGYEAGVKGNLYDNFGSFGKEVLRRLSFPEQVPRAAELKNFCEANGITPATVDQWNKDGTMPPLPMQIAMFKVAAEIGHNTLWQGTDTRAWNQTIPFLGAHVANTSKYIRNFGEHPTQAITGVAVLAAMTLLKWALSKGDVGYQEQSFAQRNNFYVPTPFGGKFLKLMGPRGVEVPIMALIDESLRAASRDNPHFDRLAPELLHALLPGAPEPINMGMQQLLNRQGTMGLSGQAIIPRQAEGEGALSNAVRYRAPALAGQATGGALSARNPLGGVLASQQPHQSVTDFHDRYAELAQQRTLATHSGRQFDHEAEYQRLHRAYEAMQPIYASLRGQQRVGGRMVPRTTPVDEAAARSRLVDLARGALGRQ